MRSEGMNVLLLFINIKLGLNAIYGYHSAMVISHDVVDRKNVIHSNIQKCTSVNYMPQSYRWVNFFCA